MSKEVLDGYRGLWEMRRQPPVVTESWADSDWAKGRTDYLTFLVRVISPEVISAAKEVQEGLRKFSCADPYPVDYMHLTVKETGCFLVEEKGGDDEIQMDRIGELVESARKALGGVHCFNVDIGRLNHFRSNIVAEAHDGGEIREMNRRLMGIEGVRKLNYDYPRFLPHMSLCQFKEAESHEALISHLEETRFTELGRIRVEQVSLVKAVLPTTGRYPVLETLDVITLE